jgi:hypothetical protein
MNLLDAVEQSVGNEYFNDSEHSEIYFDLQKMDSNLSLSLNQSHQPNSNKIVNIK